jgi:hypothetical protein
MLWKVLDCAIVSWVDLNFSTVEMCGARSRCLHFVVQEIEKKLSMLISVLCGYFLGFSENSPVVQPKSGLKGFYSVSLNSFEEHLKSTTINAVRRVSSFLVVFVVLLVNDVDVS